MKTNNKICIGDYIQTMKNGLKMDYQIMLDKETDEIFLEGSRDWNFAEKLKFNEIDWNNSIHITKENYDEELQKLLS